MDLLTKILNWLKGTQPKPIPIYMPPVALQPEPVTKKPTIQDWANAVKEAEGWSIGSPSYTHNNPGNLGYTTLTASWGARQGTKKSDGGHFAFFQDYATGFKALCNFLTLGCQDRLKAFHNARTLESFMKVYAGNPPIAYIQGIAFLLKVPPNTNISTFL